MSDDVRRLLERGAPPPRRTVDVAAAWKRGRRRARVSAALSLVCVAVVAASSWTVVAGALREDRPSGGGMPAAPPAADPTVAAARLGGFLVSSVHVSTRDGGSSAAVSYRIMRVERGPVPVCAWTVYDDRGRTSGVAEAPLRDTGLDAEASATMTVGVDGGVAWARVDCGAGEDVVGDTEGDPGPAEPGGPDATATAEPD